MFSPESRVQCMCSRSLHVPALWEALCVGVGQLSLIDETAVSSTHLINKISESETYKRHMEHRLKPQLTLVAATSVI